MSLPAFLMGAALFILAIIVVALARLLLSHRVADWVMAEQLLGTAGIAVLLLFGVATGRPGVIDLALMLTLLATFVTVAFAEPLRRRFAARWRGTSAQGARAASARPAQATRASHRTGTAPGRPELANRDPLGMKPETPNASEQRP